MFSASYLPKTTTYSESPDKVKSTPYNTIAAGSEVKYVKVEIKRRSSRASKSKLLLGGGIRRII